MKEFREISTIDDFCKEFKISRTTFYLWRKKKIAPKVIKQFGRIWIERKAIKDWLEKKDYER